MNCWSLNVSWCESKKTARESSIRGRPPPPPPHTHTQFSWVLLQRTPPPCGSDEKREKQSLKTCTVVRFGPRKAERQRIDAFKLWCWRRLLRGPWTAKRSNQSILKEINAEYSLEGLLLNLHYFGHLMPRVDSLVKTDAGKD